MLSNAFTNSCSSSKHSGSDCPDAFSVDFASAFGVGFGFFAISRILARRMNFKAHHKVEKRHCCLAITLSAILA